MRENKTRENKTREDGWMCRLIDTVTDNEKKFNMFFSLFRFAVRAVWILLLIVLGTVYVIWYRFDVTDFSNFNAINLIFVLWLVMLLTPIFPKISIGPVTLERREERDANSLVKEFAAVQRDNPHLPEETPTSPASGTPKSGAPVKRAEADTMNWDTIENAVGNFFPENDARDFRIKITELLTAGFMKEQTAEIANKIYYISKRIQDGSVTKEDIRYYNETRDLLCYALKEIYIRCSNP